MKLEVSVEVGGKSRKISFISGQPGGTEEKITKALSSTPQIEESLVRGLADNIRKFLLNQDLGASSEERSNDASIRGSRLDTGRTGTTLSTVKWQNMDWNAMNPTSRARSSFFKRKGGEVSYEIGAGSGLKMRAKQNNVRGSEGKAQNADKGRPTSQALFTRKKKKRGRESVPKEVGRPAKPSYFELFQRKKNGNEELNQREVGGEDKEMGRRSLQMRAGRNVYPGRSEADSGDHSGMIQSEVIRSDTRDGTLQNNLKALKMQLIRDLGGEMEGKEAGERESGNEVKMGDRSERIDNFAEGEARTHDCDLSRSENLSSGELETVVPVVTARIKKIEYSRNPQDTISPQAILENSTRAMNKKVSKMTVREMVSTDPRQIQTQDQNALRQEKSLQPNKFESENSNLNDKSSGLILIKNDVENEKLSYAKPSQIILSHNDYFTSNHNSDAKEQPISDSAEQKPEAHLRLPNPKAKNKNNPNSLKLNVNDPTQNKKFLTFNVYSSESCRRFNAELGCSSRSSGRRSKQNPESQRPDNQKVIQDEIKNEANLYLITSTQSKGSDKGQAKETEKEILSVTKDEFLEFKRFLKKSQKIQKKKETKEIRNDFQIKEEVDPLKNALKTSPLGNEMLGISDLEKYNEEFNRLSFGGFGNNKDTREGGKSNALHLTEISPQKPELLRPTKKIKNITFSPEYNPPSSQFSKSDEIQTDLCKETKPKELEKPREMKQIPVKKGDQNFYSFERNLNRLSQQMNADIKTPVSERQTYQARAKLSPKPNITTEKPVQAVNPQHPAQDLFAKCAQINPQYGHISDLKAVSKEKREQLNQILAQRIWKTEAVSGSFKSIKMKNKGSIFERLSRPRYSDRAKMRSVESRKNLQVNKRVQDKNFLKRHSRKKTKKHILNRLNNGRISKSKACFYENGDERRTNKEKIFDISQYRSSKYEQDSSSKMTHDLDEEYPAQGEIGFLKTQKNMLKLYQTAGKCKNFENLPRKSFHNTLGANRKKDPQNLRKSLFSDKETMIKELNKKFYYQGMERAKIKRRTMEKWRCHEKKSECLKPTFKPKINPVSELLASGRQGKDKLSDYLLKKGRLLQKRLREQYVAERALADQSHSFHPKINDRSRSLVRSRQNARFTFSSTGR